MSKLSPLEELLETSILDLTLNIKSFYALRFSQLETIRDIVNYEKDQLKREHRRLNDAMLEDIDDSIRLLAEGRGCMEEMQAFPFFDEKSDSETSSSIAEDEKTVADSDFRAVVTRYIEGVLIERKRCNRPWITASAIMKVLNKEHPAISREVTSNMVMEILTSVDWAEKDDFYYKYSKDLNDVSNEPVISGEEDAVHLSANEDVTKNTVSVENVVAENEWTDEKLEERYKEKYYLTKELLKGESDRNQNWYTATEVCKMLSDRYPTVMKGKMFSIISRVLNNASWTEISEDGLRFRWKAEEEKSDNSIEPTDRSFTEEHSASEEPENGSVVISLNRPSFNPLNAHRRDLTVSYKTYHALRLSNLETVRDIISLDKETLKREYPRIDDTMIEDIEEAVLRLVSNYDYEEETKEYPFFASVEKENLTGVTVDDLAETSDAEEVQIEERDVNESVIANTTEQQDISVDEDKPEPNGVESEPDSWYGLSDEHDEDVSYDDNEENVDSGQITEEDLHDNQEEIADENDAPEESLSEPETSTEPEEKHVLEAGETFGDEFYSSEDFSDLVEQKIHDLFVSAEKNSMTFLDIWKGLGLTIPGWVISRELNKQVEKGNLSKTEDEYRYEFISILEAIDVLPAKYRHVISMKLQGFKYDEIAKRYGVTRSRVQQIAAKGMAAIIRGTKSIPAAGRVKEDDDKELFQTYNISLGEWVTELKKPEHAYRYLSMRYKKGEAKLPGTKQVDPRKAPRAARTKEAVVTPGTIEDFLDYYNSLAGVQKAVLLYSDEEQYVKDLNRLAKRINREIKNKKYISDIRITDSEYAILRGYLHYAVKLLNKTGAAPDEAVFVTAVTNVAERVYDGNLWGNFFKEIGLKQTQTLQTNIGTKYVEILERLELLKDEEGRFFQSVLMHCFVSNHFANAYFDFLLNFYRLDLDRDISRLDTETMRALMDSICAEENVGRTYMLVQHIGQAMAANRRGATIRIRNHMKLLDKFFWDDSFEINTTHRINNFMQTWARSSKEMIGEMESYSGTRRRGAKRFSQPYIRFDSQNNSCTIVIPSQSIKAYETEDIYWRISGGTEETIYADRMESVIGYKILETSCRIPLDSMLDEFTFELYTAEGERIKRFQIRKAGIRFFDEDGYPVNANNIKIGDVTSITPAGQIVRSSALYDSREINGMLVSYFYFEFEDILHLPDGHVVIVGKPEITNSIAGKGRIEGAACYLDDKRYDLYGKVPYVVLRMKSQKFPGTSITINGQRRRLSDIEYESFSLNDKTDDVGYYINLHDYLGDANDVYRINVDIPGGSSPHWEFIFIKDFEVEFDEAPYVFEPRGTVLLPEHIKVKDISDSCEPEPGMNGYKFVIKKIGRTFDFTTEVGDHDVRICVPVPAFFIRNEDGEWDSDIPAPIWHTDLPDVIDLAVPHHKITLFMDDAFTDGSDSERAIEYRRNVGDDHILCDITRFKSYLSGDDFAKQLKMRFGDVERNLFTIIVHSKVISLQILGNFDTNDITVNADISGKADYYVDIRKEGEVVAEKIPLVNGSARLHHEIGNGIYVVEAYELVEDDSGFGGEDYYSIGVFEQEMMNPYDMTDRSFRIVQIEDRNDPKSVMPLKFNYFVLDLKKTDDNHTYNGMMVVRKRFFKGSELAALPVSVRFEDLNRPNYVWISFVDEYGDDTDFLYDTRRQGILQEENMYLKPMVCYRRYTFLDGEEQIYHIDFVQEHYSSEYDELDEFIEFPENESRIVFKDNTYDSKRKRFEVKGKEDRGNIHYSSSILFVGDAPLSPKSKMCLRDARINTLNELTNMTKADLAGRSKIATIKVIREIDKALAQYGMKFKDMEGDN